MSLGYAVSEIVLAFLITVTNAIVIWVFISKKQLRTPTNSYIASLALTDFLAGCIGIPLTVFSVVTRAPHTFESCLFIHLILCVLCTISTFQLLAIAIDKYLTICWRCQMLLDEQVRHYRARLFIVMAWISGATIALLPMFDVFGFASNNRDKFKGKCEFTVVVDYRYLIYVIFYSTIVLPSIIISLCYSAIYRKIKLEEKTVKCLLRVSERRRRMRNRRRLIRTLLILVTVYATCWFPLYILNAFDYYYPNNRTSNIPTLAAVVLSHLNCLINPVIYAFGMPGFKQVLQRFFHIRSATIKGPHLYNNITCNVQSQRYKDTSTGAVRGYIVDYTRKNSRSHSICNMGKSLDSVEMFLTPVYDSRKHQLHAISESNNSLIEKSANYIEK